MIIKVMNFRLTVPTDVRFEVAMGQSEEFGTKFNVRFKGKVFQGDTMGEAVGKMFNSVPSSVWANLYRKES